METLNFSPPNNLEPTSAQRSGAAVSGVQLPLGYPQGLVLT